MILESVLPAPPQHQPLAPIVLPQTLATLMHTSRAPGHLSLVCENISINETLGLFFFERLQYSQPSIYVGSTSTDSTNLRAKMGLLRWLRAEESACSTGYAGATDSIPGLERSPGEGNGNPLQYSCLENLMDRGAWRTTVHGVTKSRTQLSD